MQKNPSKPYMAKKEILFPIKTRFSQKPGLLAYFMLCIFLKDSSGSCKKTLFLKHNTIHMNNIGYSGYTTNFPSVSHSFIQQPPSARSFALLTSTSQFCLTSRLLFARLRLAFLLEKSVEYLTYLLFFPSHEKQGCMKTSVNTFTFMWT